MVLLQSFMNLLGNYFVLLFTCEIFQYACDEFNKIDDTVEQFDWYLYPEEIKRMLPTVMIMVQQPLEFNCFGSLTCCRETDKKVRFDKILKRSNNCN